jgi:hypothetical protein
MDDFSRRMDRVETDVMDMKPQVASVLALIPHLATKTELANVKAELKTDIAVIRGELAEVRAVIPHLATSADVEGVVTNLAKLESAMIKWVVATGLTSTGLACTIVKFLH